LEQLRPRHLRAPDTELDRALREAAVFDFLGPAIASDVPGLQSRDRETAEGAREGVGSPEEADVEKIEPKEGQTWALDDGVAVITGGAMRLGDSATTHVHVRYVRDGREQAYKLADFVKKGAVYKSG
jgi:hypothetical protein